jgi:hypothetical protein
MTKDKRFNVIELFVLKLKGYRMFHVGKQVKLLPRFRKFLAFGILLLSMSADFIISGEQIISLFPHEIAQYIVSFLCYDLQTFDCLRKTSKYWKEICDSEKISLRVLENLREQNYKLPQGYNEKELD